MAGTDLIRRQDIEWHDYLVADGNGMYHNEQVAYRSQIDAIPSAQPELIRCKDCKWKQGAECVRFADIRPFPEDFCSRGERRTDEL